MNSSPPLTDDSYGLGRTLIDDLLDEQQLLTPVATFSRKHEGQTLPAQAKYYSDLIPLSSPAPGEQYAFAVDLDACTGCKACVTACHNLNGLDDDETWRDVGVLFGGTTLEPVQQTITTACHHCVDPGCMNGCPVKAYDKNPVTGIVRHLDDQCIGCQYCIWKCPYDVPKYSKKRGIVRKCDMCSSRLAVGEAPACVQACPNEAITITLVNKEQIAHQWKQHESFLPGSPDPDYTLPTTQYRTRKTLPDNLRPGDFFKNKPEHAHLPLVVMLVLTQLSVGAFCTATILRLFFPPELLRELMPFHSLVALLLGFLALGASTMHLGRPLEAWRSFVGLRTSWLSREIIVFGLFAMLALVYAGSFWLPALSRFVSIPFGRELSTAPLQIAFGIGVAVTGLAGVFSSMMIYRDTRRTFWRTKFAALKFTGTTLTLGPATILLTMILQSAFSPAIAAHLVFRQVVSLLSGLVAVVMIAKLLWEFQVFTHLNDHEWTDMKRTALLMAGVLKRVTISRFVCGALGGFVLPALVLIGLLPPTFAAGILPLSVLGELLERYLFFTAVIPPKMPGGIAS
jgi:Fe-S-cluster-containing dehydrogenase component/DMSO reductase anchor subunit